MSIGLEVKRLRKAKKISAVEFARRCGKSSRQWTYDVEKGNINSFSQKLLKNIAKILDVPENHFFSIDDSTLSDNIELYNVEESDLNKIQGYKEKYLYLLIENRKLMSENIKLKNVIIENNITLNN